MPVVIGVVVALGLLIALFAGTRTFGAPGEPARRPVPIRREGDRAVITLDLAGVDSTAPAVKRLIDDAASHAFAAMRDVQELEFQSRDGAKLGVRHRSQPLPPPVEIPRDLLEPHHHPSVRSLVPDEDRHDRAHPHFVADEYPKARPLADRFELPAGIRVKLEDPNDAVALVAAILAAGGAPVVIDHSVIRVGDAAIIVVGTHVGEHVSRESLNHAFHIFSQTKARRGIVVTPGHVDSHDVQRRELLAPQLLHAGPDGIQRMADAVALGADPLPFVLPMKLTFAG